MRILLTGTRAPVALDLARAFRACGHEVHGVDSLRSAVLGGVLDSFSLCASPRRQPEAFARDADRIVNAVRSGLIISLCEDIFYWSRLAESHGWPIFAPGLPVLMRLHSKFAFIELARSLALAAPETQRLSPGTGASEYRSVGIQARIFTFRHRCSGPAEKPAPARS
ncbi:MAG: hypothetical protein WDN06_17210 [Asticcacaulis sp.]